MGGHKVKIAFMEMARDFISSLPEKAQKKITYNLLKVEGGEMDKELFKKLENSEIWELRTLLQWNLLPSVCFLGHGNRGVGDSYSWNSEKDTENAFKGDRKGRGIKKRIFQQ